LAHRHGYSNAQDSSLLDEIMDFFLRIARSGWILFGVNGLLPAGAMPRLAGVVVSEKFAPGATSWQRIVRRSRTFYGSRAVDFKIDLTLFNP
jgi:hypothetical protein